MKTIAIVINTSWNIYNFRLGLIKALQNEGFNVVAISPADDYSQKLEDLGIKHYDIKINNKGTNPLEDAKLVLTFRKLYKEIAPDVILQYTIKPNIYGSMAAGMLGIPVISNISGLGTVFLSDSLSSKIARMLYKVAMKVPKRVFFQNTHDRELFIESGLVKSEKTDLLPGSGIDTEKFKPLPRRSRESDSVRFLFIARLVRDKGLLEYVEAAKRLRATDYGLGVTKEQENRIIPNRITNHESAEFHILGSFYPGNPTAITESQMKEWEEEGIVSYIGVSDDVKTIINEYDCIVLPSYREGLSRVLLEAASMAKPIITTNVPGCKEVVDDGINGYLCEVKSADSLAEKMRRFLALTPEERREMGRKGREKVAREFDEKLVIKKYQDVIIEVLNKP